MDKIEVGRPTVFKPKKVDENRYDEDGVLHEDCGTPECCNECDPEEEVRLAVKEVRREKNDAQLRHEEKVFGK